MRSMPDPRRLYLLLFGAALAAAFLARTLYYYPGPLQTGGRLRSPFYRPPQVIESTPVAIESLAGSNESAPAAGGGAGRLVLIDSSHDNAFGESELAGFTARLTSAGAAVRLIDSDLPAALAEADTLLVIAPSITYQADEIQAVSDFVAKGGRLILVGEPTRLTGIDAINSLAGAFGIIYDDAYLYNLIANDGGFRNVLFTEFGASPLTRGLDTVTFQTAHALRAEPEAGLIFGDENTASSRSEQPGGQIAAALTAEGRVLALSDFTFFTSPYNTFADNPRLLDNIATFALGSARDFSLADFPYFFDGPTLVVYQNPVTLDATFAGSVALRGRLESAGVAQALAEEPAANMPFIYLALYEDVTDEVLDLLADDGITLSDEPLSEADDAPRSQGTIAIEDVARFDQGGTVLLHLSGPTAAEDGTAAEETRPYELVILAEDTDLLSAGIDRLLNGTTGDCLVTARTAVCRDGEGGGGEPDTGGAEDDEGGAEAANILIVSDDQALLGPVGKTSADALGAALDAAGIGYTILSIADDGSPDLDTLNDYDAVLWSIGDYCCTAPTEDAAQILADYVSGGGRLLIEGMFIATDWDSSDFLLETLGAELAGFAPQLDLEPADEHPLTEGFSGPVTFTEQDTSLQPDVITPTGKAETIFVRGPESERAGDPALIAYEEGNARVAYAAFPLFLLEDGDLAQLAENAVAWLTGE